VAEDLKGSKFQIYLLSHFFEMKKKIYSLGTGVCASGSCIRFFTC